MACVEFRFVAEFLFVERKSESTEKDEFISYSGTRYIDDRARIKSLVIDSNYSDTDRIDGLQNPTPLADGVTDFNIKLVEPFVIDNHCDVYLDNFTTEGTLTGPLYFCLGIDQFQIQTGSTLDKNVRKIMIPNQTTTDYEKRIHKGLKMNYVCTMNPGKLYEISGTITDDQGAPVAHACNGGGGGGGNNFQFLFNRSGDDGDMSINVGDSAVADPPSAGGSAEHEHTSVSSTIEIQYEHIGMEFSHIELTNMSITSEFITEGDQTTGSVTFSEGEFSGTISFTTTSIEPAPEEPAPEEPAPEEPAPEEPAEGPDPEEGGGE